jgi:hypothetical protein
MYRCALHRYAGGNGRKPDRIRIREADRAFSSLRLPASQHGFRDEWETLPYRSCSQRKLGAGERSRTFTTLQSPDFESDASASSATPANKNLDVISAPRVTRRPEFLPPQLGAARVITISSKPIEGTCSATSSYDLHFLSIGQ